MAVLTRVRDGTVPIAWMQKEVRKTPVVKESSLRHSLLEKMRSLKLSKAQTQIKSVRVRSFQIR
jgi:hypothetical protein